MSDNNPTEEAESTTDKRVLELFEEHAPPQPDASLWKAAETFIKVYRSRELEELAQAHLPAVVLALFVALRAQRTSRFNKHNLRPGEALVGDWKTMGMSERQYRTAKQVLQKAKIATFKATTKGTVATLIDSGLFDANILTADEQKDEQTTNRRRTDDGQATTTKKEKKEKNAKKEGGFAIPSLEEVEAYGGEIGLDATECRKFHNHFKGNGWRVGGRAPMRDWRASLENWKERVPQFSGRSGGGAAPMAAWQVSKLIEAKQGEMREFKGRHYSEHAMGGSWDSEIDRETYRAMKAELEGLKEQLKYAGKTPAEIAKLKRAQPI